MQDRDIARIIAGEDPFGVALELAERHEPPFDGPPTIPVDRIHEAARKARAKPGAIYHARPPLTSRNRWGFSDCVSFTLYEHPVAHCALLQTIISSRSRHRVHAFVNLIAGLRGAGASLDETFRTSGTYETAKLPNGRTAYFVGIAAIPGSRI